MVPLAEWTDLKAEHAHIGLEFQKLRFKHEKILLENWDFRKQLLVQSQDQHRQAGPFSRNKPKANPKPPGRKSGKK